MVDTGYHSGYSFHCTVEGVRLMEAIEKFVDGDIATVEPRVREELVKRGFGVLTEIDVAATLKAKIGVERNPLKILGACNPGFANRALEADPTVALMMPCNVVLSQEGNQVRISAVDPTMLMDSPGMKALADEAVELLRAAVSAV